MKTLHKLLIILAAGAGLTTPHLAYSIGRVGNDQIGDPRDGYTALVPPDFNQIILADRDSAILQSNYIFDPEFGLTVAINAFPFSNVYPELTAATEAKVVEYFQGAPMMHYVKVTTPNCSLSLLGEGDSTWVGVSTWGEGKGYVVAATKTDEAKQGILNLLQATKIVSRCWN